MESLDDIALLRQYATGGSEAAFETLVSRRIDFVYSAALRQVRDPHLAQEVTQSVFVLLARKAGGIPDRAVLAGWLFNATRLTALEQIRLRAKRRQREQELRTQTEIESAEADPLWNQLSPLLDEALATLGEKDRRAVLLRFFQSKSLAQVGSALNLGEEAARKRVTRALEKLHGYFLSHGVSSTTALLAAAISSHSVHAAPAALAKSATVLAIAKGAAGSGSTLTLMKGALKLMAWSKAQTAGVGLVITGLTILSVLQYQSQASRNRTIQALQDQLQILQADNGRLSNLVSQANALPAPQANPSQELLRLRGEVGVLRQQSNDLRQLLAGTQNRQRSRSLPVQESSAGLPEDYPKTPEAATKNIFEVLARGDFEGFFTNFAEPGVPKELYDKMFNNERVRSYLAGLTVLSVGQPTNSFGPNMWFVPYRIRLNDGTEKEMQLHIAQDPRTQKWWFKGGI